MKCVLVFDHVNDIIYSKYNKRFSDHISTFAKAQGLLEDEDNSSKLCVNILVQIFSPVVTSHRIMNCQFGNSYTSIRCQKDVNITFEDYMGYLFVYISNEDTFTMTKFLRVCVTLTRYLCGPDVLVLKIDKKKAKLLTYLIDAWNYITLRDQAVFVEAIEQLLVNSDLTKMTVQSLRESVDKLQGLIECTKIHGLLVVNNKFVGLYSSQNAKDLAPADILFSMLLCEISKNLLLKSDDNESDDDDEFFSPNSTPNEVSYPLNNIYTYHVLLSGTDMIPRCVPYVIHIHQIYENINLLFFVEAGNAKVAGGLYDAFLHLHSIQLVQIQRNVGTLRPVFENLDNSIKRLCEALKKLKNNSLKNAVERLGKTWEFMRKKYQEFLKNQSADALLRAESLTCGLLENLKEILSLNGWSNYLFDTMHWEYVIKSSKLVIEKLSSFDEFLKVKSMKNFSLGSSSLTINKYLEEFPGLVHFIYVDRTNHRVTAPGIDFSTDEIIVLTKNKIWSMIKFARLHLNEGHMSIMWKDTTFSYAYFLWFEDISGSPLKPTVFPSHLNKPLPKPGIFCDDFYQRLKEACFPKMAPQKIRCYELYTIHLGLVTSQCVLEHTRRLSATIWELKGHPDHPIDLL